MKLKRRIAKAEADKKVEEKAKAIETETKLEAEQKAKEEAEAKVKAEEKAKAKGEEKVKAEEKAKAKEEEKVKAEEKAKAKEEEKVKAEEKAKAKEEEKVKAEEKAAAEQKIKEEAKISAEKEKKTATTEIPVWKKEIAIVAGNSDGVSDKFYALEKFLISHKITKAEVKEFSSYIVSDYKSGHYLSDISNHERMLTNILKSYYVEKNSKGALKDFAFDYFQNMKNTYRGVDAVDGYAVKANEDQMNKVLKEIK